MKKILLVLLLIYQVLFGQKIDCSYSIDTIPQKDSLIVEIEFYTDKNVDLFFPFFGEPKKKIYDYSKTITWFNINDTLFPIHDTLYTHDWENTGVNIGTSHDNTGSIKLTGLYLRNIIYLKRKKHRGKRFKKQFYINKYDTIKEIKYVFFVQERDYSYSKRYFYIPLRENVISKGRDKIYEFYNDSFPK